MCSTFLGWKFYFCKLWSWITKFRFPIRLGFLWIRTNVSIWTIKCQFAIATATFAFLWRARVPRISCSFLRFIFCIWNCKNQPTKSDNYTRTSVTLCKKYLHFCTIKCKLYTMKIQIAFVRKGHIYSRKLQFVDANFAFESANNEFEKVKLHIWTYS